MSDLITLTLTPEEQQELLAHLACGMRCMTEQQQVSPIFRDRWDIATHRRGLCAFYWRLSCQERLRQQAEDVSLWHRCRYLLLRLMGRATPMERPGIEQTVRQLARQIQASGYEDFWDQGAE